jgi:hypothetical protein
VTDVLAVPALEERHPVPHLVLLEADHVAPHGVSLVTPTIHHVHRNTMIS